MEHEESNGNDINQLRRAVEATNDGIWDWHIKSGEVYYSPRWKRMLGYEPEELSSHVSSWEKLLHPEDHDKTVQAVFAHMEAGSPSFELEFRMRTKSGEWKWILSRGKVFEWDEEGKPIRMIGTHTDITERKKVEEELVQQSNALQAANAYVERILATIPLAVVVSDTNARIQKWNKSAELLFGWTSEEVVGKLTFYDCIVPEHEREGIAQVVADILSEKISLEEGKGENRNQNITKDGRILTCQWYNTVIRDYNGNIIGLVSLGNDVTEQISREEERLIFQERLIEAQRASLRELSAPLLPISDSVILLPLIGSIDSYRAQQIMETLLEGVATYQADVAILDITGVAVVDTQIANVILQAARAVQLLGSKVVLTGIGPAMAMTLVTLGADLSGVITCGNLQSGIAYAMGATRK